MKKFVCLCLSALMLLTCLSACGSSKKEMDMDGFIQELLKNAEFTDSLDRLSDAVVPVLYGIEPADYSEASVYAGTAATAEEIAVFKAVDAAASERILNAAKARVASQIETYKNYGPAAAMLLEDAVVEKIGEYVVVVVCTDNKGADAVVEQYRG